MAEVKNNVFADKLAGLKLDYEYYGRLPMRMDVQALVAPDGKNTADVVSQFDKLQYIREHLKKIDDYIKAKTNVPINEWSAKNNKNLSTKVLSKLKGHTNETGGISKYFHDLQTIYDSEEALYDKMEADCKSDEASNKMFYGMRADRDEKRKTRSAERKLLVKDLKKDGKGFLFVEVEEAPVAKEEVKKEEKENEHAADGDSKEKIEKEVDKIQKTTKNVGIYIAGFTILLTAVIVVASATKEK